MSLRPAVQKGRWTWSRGKKGQIKTTKTNLNPQQSSDASKHPTSMMWVTCWHTSLWLCSCTWFRIQRAKEELQWEVDRTVSLGLPEAKVGHEIGECEWTAAAFPLKCIMSTLCLLPTFLWEQPQPGTVEGREFWEMQLSSSVNQTESVHQVGGWKELTIQWDRCLSVPAVSIGHMCFVLLLL